MSNNLPASIYIYFRGASTYFVRFFAIYSIIYLKQLVTGPFLVWSPTVLAFASHALVK